MRKMNDEMMALVPELVEKLEKAVELLGKTRSAAELVISYLQDGNLEKAAEHFYRADAVIANDLGENWGLAQFLMSLRDSETESIKEWIGGEEDQLIYTISKARVTDEEGNFDLMKVSMMAIKHKLEGCQNPDCPTDRVIQEAGLLEVIQLTTKSDGVLQ